MAALFLVLLASTSVYGAPYPATGSSRLVAPELGLFWKRQGFSLKSGATGWQISTSLSDEDQVRYIRPSMPSASLAVRVETLKSEMTLENYTKHWMKDYSNYGFDLLNSQTFFQNGARGLVVDLVHKNSDQQLRQVIFLKNKKIVILTCRDQLKTFEQTLKDCNQISKSFEWTESSRTTF